jgi:hypothetical protein
MEIDFPALEGSAQNIDLACVFSTNDTALAGITLTTVWVSVNFGFRDISGSFSDRYPC